jgi:hypothetical protein
MLLTVGSFGYFARRIERSNLSTVTVIARDNEQTRKTVEGYWREIDRARDDVLDAAKLRVEILATLPHTDRSA